jgi:hypothetical protein
LTSISSKIGFPAGGVLRTPPAALLQGRNGGQSLGCRRCYESVYIFTFFLGCWQGGPLAEGIHDACAEKAAPARPCGDGREAPKEAVVLKTLTERKNYAQICEDKIVLIR